MALDNQLQNYVIDLQSNAASLELKGINDLAQKKIEIKKDILYPLVCRPIKVVFALPVGTDKKHILYPHAYVQLNELFLLRILKRINCMIGCAVNG